MLARLDGRTGYALLGAMIWVTGCGTPVMPPDGNGADLDAPLRAALAANGVTAMTRPSLDAARVELGQALFFDKILSGNRNISCSTCHLPDAASGDGLSLSIGQGGTGRGPERVPPVNDADEPVLIPRNAPEAFNRGDFSSMFWDGRVAEDGAGGFTNPAGDQLLDGLDNALAVQAMFPVTSRDEMRGAAGQNEVGDWADDDWQPIWATLMTRLLAYDAYVALFAAAYPEVETAALTFAHAANAMAAFEIDHWTLDDAPFDVYLAGNDDALDAAAKRGGLLYYGKARCGWCHAGTLMTDERFHNRVIPQIGPGKQDGGDGTWDYGRERVTGQLVDRCAFRTPPLRNVAATGPWMHDGAYTTLEGAVRHMLDPIGAGASYDVTQLDAALQPLYHAEQNDAIEEMASQGEIAAVVLSDAELADLLTFLEALTSPTLASLPARDRPASVPSGLSMDD